MKLFVICGCSDSDSTDKNNCLHVMRNLRARGHEASLLDLSTISSLNNGKLADARSPGGNEESSKALEIMKRCDAVIIVASQNNSYIPKRVFELAGMKLNKENVQNSCVWDNCGVCCTIIANAKRKQRVAKELWAILNSSYDRLDVSDFLPFGKPVSYHCDPKLETAGPCVV